MVSDTRDISVKYRMTDYFQKRWFTFPVKKQEASHVELDEKEIVAHRIHEHRKNKNLYDFRSIVQTGE